MGSSSESGTSLLPSPNAIVKVGEDASGDGGRDGGVPAGPQRKRIVGVSSFHVIRAGTHECAFSIRNAFAPPAQFPPLPLSYERAASCVLHPEVCALNLPP
jgi:hypothetical protein